MTEQELTAFDRWYEKEMGSLDLTDWTLCDAWQAACEWQRQQLEAQPEPEGWKLVPVEPTQKMLNAGYYPCVQGRGSKSVWAEMLMASPPRADMEGEV